MYPVFVPRHINHDTEIRHSSLIAHYEHIFSINIFILGIIPRKYQNIPLTRHSCKMLKPMNYP